MPESEIPPNPSNPVNLWEPVTDFYQEAVAAGLETQPSQSAPRKRNAIKEKKSAKKLPLGIKLFILYYFVLAGFYLLVTFLIEELPGSDFTSFVLAHSVGQPGGPRLVSLRFAVLGVIYAYTGGLWLFRSWRVRWFSMCSAGANVVKTVVWYAMGQTAALSMEQKRYMFVRAALDLLIFGYLFTNPDVQKAFADGESD